MGIAATPGSNYVNAYEHWKQGNYGMAAVHAAIATVDVAATAIAEVGTAGAATPEIALAHAVLIFTEN